MEASFTARLTSQPRQNRFGNPMNLKGHWRKGIAEWVDDLDPGTVNISVVFSWDAGRAYSRAVWWRQKGFRVRVGGPGVFLRKRDFDGVAEVGGDLPDAVQRHNPAATFSSRGCPVGCYFCIVPAMEGREFTLFPDFTPRPVLCDNNLSALPLYYQSYVVKRYKMTGTPLLDANSGFEPATFDEEVYRLWKPINRGPWRYAFDETREEADVRRVCLMLRGLKAQTQTSLRSDRE